MKRKFSIVLLSGVLMVMPFGAWAAPAEPVRLEPIRLIDSEMPPVAGNSRFSFMPGRKANPDKRSAIDKISDKLEESRRVRESKRMAREREKTRQQSAQKQQNDGAAE